ncbi:3-oxoadipate enol-lactonase [Marinosulfonomonas sp. PRT-SC04]|nr:3-oxoadipate enol-lactonase [Marinosulfonomonas sp. PRT-SC04]
MQMITLNGMATHYADEGNPNGPAVVFSNALGTDLRLWDQLMPLLPKSLRLIRYDTRGHGLSSAPEGDYFMGDLVADAAALLDHLKVKDCIFVGLSIGGMIAQGLAAERMDLVRAMVLSNTAAKIGTPAIWQQRIAEVRRGGIESLEVATLARWFTARFHQDKADALAGWRHMLCRTSLNGYLGCSAAISETDLFESTARLSLPTLAIAGSEDGSTPPDLVRETADLIRGSRFQLIRKAAHLPCIEQPENYAALLTEFLQQQGHI